MGPSRGPARAPACIGHTHVSHQAGRRPTVGGDFVQHRHHHVFIVGDAEKPCPQRDLGGQVKPVAHHGADGVLHLASRPSGGINDVPAEIGLVGGHHQLLRYPVDRPEQGAQALMAADHIDQRRTQRVRIEAPTQPQRHHHVVKR